MKLRPSLDSFHRRPAILAIVLAAAALQGRDTLFRASSHLAQDTSTARTATAKRIANAYGRLPLAFEEHTGQVAPDVKFLSRGSGYTLFLASTEAVLALRNPSREPEQAQAVLRMKLVGGSPAALASGRDELPGKSNYLTGRNPEDWRTGVRRFAKVEYDDVYPGVDLVYYGNQQQLEYDFIVAPGADPQRIRLAFDGAHTAQIDDGGDLVLQTGADPVRLRKPVIYQDVEGVRRQITGGYVLENSNEVTFQVGSYDATRPLIVDPVVVYSTFVGGSTYDLALDITVDVGGYAYVVGNTLSIDFPVANPAQSTCATMLPPGSATCDDVFVTKLNRDGAGIEYSTYIGGTSTDIGNGIAVDGAGNALIVGTTTSMDFPTINAVQPDFRSDPAFFPEAFVAKLSATGSELVYATYLGGSSEDQGNAIAVDQTGAAYVTGTTYSTDFPTANPLQASNSGGLDAYVAKLAPDGTALAYSTYIGGENYDIAYGIAVSAEGQVTITGETNSMSFPTVNAAQPAIQGQNDAFVTTIVPDGSALAYSSYLGGPGFDIGTGIAVANQTYYVIGITTGDFPVTDGQPYGGGSCDAFVAILNFDGQPGYSRYLGGVEADLGSGIAVDPAGNVYLTGSTRSPDFPVVNALQAHSGNDDLFVAKLNSSQELIYSTYLGGQGMEAGADGAIHRGPSVAVDPEGNAYVTGTTGSPDFPISPGAFQTELRSSANAFVVKIFDDGAPPARADLSIVETDIEAAEGEVRYLFTITNNGPAGASDVIFHDSLPETVTFNWGFIVTAWGGSGTCFHDGHNVTCYLGGVPAGASAQVGLSVTSPTAPTVTNIAVVTLSESDPNPGNNEIRSTRLIPDLSISGSTEQHGTDLHYFFRIRNDGPGRADAVRFRHQLPPGVTVKDTLFGIETSTVPILSSCTNEDGLVACDVDTLLPGSTAFARIIITPAGAGTLTSTATVAFAGADYDTRNNSVTLNTVFEQPRADLSIAYSRSRDVVNVGDTLTYTFDVVNKGPSEATDAFLIDRPSEQEAFVSATTNRGGCEAGGSYIWCSFGSMPAEAQARVTVVVKVVGTGFGTGFLRNEAALSSSVDDPSYDNNSVTIVTPVNRVPVANAGADQVVSVGATCQAVVTLTGTGSSDPDGDALTYTWTSDTLLPPPPVVLSSESGGVANGPTVTGPLPLGRHTIVLTVSDGRGGLASDSVVVTVQDTTPPVFANVSPPITLEQAGPLGTSTSVPLPTATDNCPGPLFISNDAPAIFPRGTTTVTFLTCDGSCNRASATTTVTVVDTTMPVLNVVSPQARDYLHPDVLVATFSAADGGSGLAPGSPSAMLDGAAVANGQSIALLTMALGSHTLVVSAADNAGNSHVQPVTFRIIATIESLITTVNLFVADRSIADSGTANGLLAKLADAKEARDNGRNNVAVNKLSDFIDQVRAREGDRITTEAARLLIADAQYVVDTLR